MHAGLRQAGLRSYGALAVEKPYYRAVIRYFNPRVPNIKVIKILWVPSNCSQGISQKFTGAITSELKILRVPGTRGTRPNKAPVNGALYL